MKNVMPVIREEIPEDYEPIRNLNRLAFGGNEEAELVDRLRSTGIVVASLVAIEIHEIVVTSSSANCQSRPTKAALMRCRLRQW